MQIKEERRKIRIRRKRRSQTQRREKKKAGQEKKKVKRGNKRRERRVHNENLHEIKGTQSNFRSSRVEEKISKTGGQKIKI